MLQPEAGIWACQQQLAVLFPAAMWQWPWQEAFGRAGLQIGVSSLTAAAVPVGFLTAHSISHQILGKSSLEYLYWSLVWQIPSNFLFLGSAHASTIVTSLNTETLDWSGVLPLPEQVSVFQYAASAELRQSFWMHPLYTWVAAAAFWGQQPSP